jgi:hypothetical protein
MVANTCAVAVGTTGSSGTTGTTGTTGPWNELTMVTFSLIKKDDKNQVHGT